MVHIFRTGLFSFNPVLLAPHILLSLLLFLLKVDTRGERPSAQLLRLFFFLTWQLMQAPCHRIRNNTDYFSFICHNKRGIKNQLQLTLQYVIILGCDTCIHVLVQRRDRNAELS